MSISKYQVFLKTVSCGSFSKAAEAMNFTQSGISHAINSLENELGVKLLSRNRGGVVLAAVGFLPETLNTTANAVVSFVCAMQVQTFRKVRGHAYASTMCIGNMRSGTEALCAYFHTGDKEILHKALTYFGVVLLFALGAGIGSIATLHWGARTIWLSCGLLTVSFLIMFIHDEEQKLNE